MASASRRIGGKPRDPCWKHGAPGAVEGEVICIHCTKSMTGSINQLKYHLARIPCRDVRPCEAASEQVEREAKVLLAAFEQTKGDKKRTAEAMVAPIPDFSSIGSQGDMGASSSIEPRTQGPRSVGSHTSSFSIPCNTSGAQPSLQGRELQHEAKLACARFWYYNNISFNVASSPYWEQLINALTVVGKGFKAPSPYELSGPLLQDEVQNTRELVEEQRKIWEKKGCTILFDGWTDDKNRTLINFLVASGGQLVFLKSIDASNEIKNAETLCNMLDEVVIEVGVQNVIQIVTNNATAYVAAGKLLEGRHPTLFWSPCAAHCLDLLLEDIGKLSWVKNVVEDGRNITKFIYNHTWVLNLMREHTDGKDLVRSGVTRFATNFLTLQSILATMPNLKRMFMSERWLESPYCRKVEADKVVKTIFDDRFSKVMEEIINVRRQNGFRSYSKSCHFDLMQVVSHNTSCPINSSAGLYRVNGSYKTHKRRGRTLAYASGNKHIEDLTDGKEENSNKSRQNVDIVVGTSDNSSSIPVMASDQKSEPQAPARNLLARDGDESDSASSQTATQRIESHDESTSSPMIPANSSSVPSDVSRMEYPSIKSQQKSFTSGKLSLSAQEKLRTARTLSGFAESNKPAMPQPGKSLLDALRESDKQGKTTKFGQPVEPSNLFDDKKRGSPDEWGKFVFTLAPGQLFLLLSFLLISGIMFGTTYIVWKVGAIHYNEY